MEKEKVDNQEDFILKKIRYYQGSIEDYETYWNQKIAQGQAELSPETKACKQINADLNKDYEIIPVQPDNEENKPKPLSSKEKNEIEGSKKKKKKDDEK